MCGKWQNASPVIAKNTKVRVYHPFDLVGKDVLVAFHY